MDSLKPPKFNEHKALIEKGATQAKTFGRQQAKLQHDDPAAKILYGKPGTKGKSCYKKGVTNNRNNRPSKTSSQVNLHDSHGMQSLNHS